MKPFEILKRYFVRKQQVNPKYSLRSFARDLEVNPAFLSRVMNGKQEIPVKRVQQIAEILDMDKVAIDSLKLALVNEFTQELGLTTENLLGSSKRRITLYEDSPMTLKEMSILSPWYNIAILELATCQEIDWRMSSLSTLLGISKEQAEKSLKYLLQNGFLEVSKDGYNKTKKHWRFPTRKSAELIRSFHKAMMELAIKEMAYKTDAESFEKRLITSTSIAVNPKHLPEAKDILFETQLQISELLRQGSCTEVYDLTFALFPLTQKK